MQEIVVVIVDEPAAMAKEFVESYGGRVVLAELVEGKSSTATIEKIRLSQAKSE